MVWTHLDPGGGREPTHEDLGVLRVEVEHGSERAAVGVVAAEALSHHVTAHLRIYVCE